MPAQLRQFLEDIDDHRLGLAFFLAATPGCGGARCSGSDGTTSNLDGSRISVRHAVLNVADELILADVKTKNSRRTIDLDARTVACC